MSTSALPRLKLFVWILLIPTYNSGIEQYFNYTKHFERKKKVGGVAYKCGKIASVSSDLLYFGMSAWFFFGGGGVCITVFRIILVFGKQGTGNVDYSKILLAWIVTSFFFLVLRMILFIYRTWINGTLAHSTSASAGQGPRSAPLRIDSSTFGLK